MTLARFCPSGSSRANRIETLEFKSSRRFFEEIPARQNTNIRPQEQTPSRAETKMNTPSPLVPQGTFPDNRGRSHIRIAVFTILAVHIVLLGALLMAGCKKTTDTTGESATAYTNAPFQPPTNPPPLENNPPT